MRLLPALLAAALLAPPAVAQRAPDWTGVWRNERDSLRIRIARCGQGMCGRVVSASAKARADAELGSGRALIGTEMFHDFRRDADGRWYGEVYIPDRDVTLDGTIEQVDRDTLVGSACLFGSLGCAAQTWKRVR